MIGGSSPQIIFQRSVQQSISILFVGADFQTDTVNRASYDRAKGCESEYFRFELYRNGNLHIVFKRPRPGGEGQQDRRRLLRGGAPRRPPLGRLRLPLSRACYLERRKAVYLADPPRPGGEGQQDRGR
jgi:hypothetical protein